MSAAHEPIREVAVNPMRINRLDAACFSADGLAITQPLEILKALGHSDPAALLGHLPEVHRGGVQTAPTGVIQDPAGSAIGSGGKPAGGGASGAIYAKFPDLEPIDPIALCSAIFNRSTGPGHRILHTHSPRLGSDPVSSHERNRALTDLANAYYNALAAMQDRAGALGADGGLLNLVPVAAGIYGGGFVHPRFMPPHLDPSYTITALLLAVGERVRHSEPVVPLALYYHGEDTYREALRFSETVSSRSRPS